MLAGGDGVDGDVFGALAQAQRLVQVVRRVPEQQVAHVAAGDVHAHVVQDAPGRLLVEVLEDEGEDQAVARRDEASRRPWQLRPVRQPARNTKGGIDLYIFSSAHS